MSWEQFAESAQRKAERQKRLSQGLDVLACDGVQRSAEDDREISLRFARLLGSEDGKALTEYLRSITINRIQGPHTPDSELRHLEGQRFLLAIIERRIDLGRQ